MPLLVTVALRRICPLARPGGRDIKMDRKVTMGNFSRRNMLAAGAVAGAATVATNAFAATFGNPDDPAQGLVNTRTNPAAAADPGPRNPALADQFPSGFTPPATDIGDLPL